MQQPYNQIKAMLAISKASLRSIFRSPSAVIFSLIYCDLLLTFAVCSLPVFSFFSFSCFVFISSSPMNNTLFIPFFSAVLICLSSFLPDRSTAIFKPLFRNPWANYLYYDAADHFTIMYSSVNDFCSDSRLVESKKFWKVTFPIQNNRNLSGSTQTAQPGPE